MTTRALFTSTVKLMVYLETGQNVTAATLRMTRTDYLISDDILVTVRRMLNVPVQMSIAVISIFTNLINLLIFWKIGSADSVTITFVGTALADVFYAIFLLTFRTLDILDAYVGLYPFEPLKHLAYQGYWISFLFGDIATALTVFNAVQKCACVALPFVFKNIFTTSRTFAAVVGIFCTEFAIYLPNLVNPNNQMVFDYNLNRTRLGYYYWPSIDRIDIFMVFTKVVFPSIFQIIVVFSLIVLTSKLKQALQLRISLLDPDKNFQKNNQNLPEPRSVKSKELHVIQMVTLLTAIFICCNTLDVGITFTRKYYPEFGDNGRYEGIFKLLSSIQDTLVVISSGINIVIFMKYNTKFHRSFLQTFGLLSSHQHVSVIQ